MSTQDKERAVFAVAPGDGYRYVWHGGEYVEVFRVRDILANADAAAVDVINVWDYATGQPAIPRTLTAFLATVDTYRAGRTA